MKSPVLTRLTLGITTLAAYCLVSGSPAHAQTSDTAPSGFVPQAVAPSGGGSHFKIYKNYNAWFGFNASETVLQGPPFNFVLGTDYAVLSMAALSAGVPAGTDVVFIPGASSGNFLNQITEQKAPAAQAALDAFIRGGGCLVIVLGDNACFDAYKVPGLLGTADDAGACNGLTIVDASHPFILGPDQAPGGGDDLTNDNIDARKQRSFGRCNFCADLHGSLSSILPGGATVHIRDERNGNPAFAEYSLGAGKVLTTTRPMEFRCDNPQILINWFFYAIELARGVKVAVDIKPRSCPNPLKVGKNGVLPVAILGTAGFDVTDIDASSVRLAGVAPLRSSLEDVATPLGAPSAARPVLTLAGLYGGPPINPIHGNPTPPFPILGDGHHFRVEDETPGDCVNVTYSFTWTPAVIAFFGGADVSSGAQKVRIRDAFAEWNTVTPGIEFTEVVGATATISVGTAANFFSTGFPGALGLGGGLSSHHAAGPDTAEFHHLHDHLAVQNGLVSWHNGAGLPPGGLFDYLSVAEQEVGHAIGLGHNAGDTSSVMFPFISPGIRRAPPNAADEASLDFLYPGAACNGPKPPKPGPNCDQCTDEGPDGFLDLTLKFDAQLVVAALGEVADRDCVTVKLTGNLKNGRLITGKDDVLILKKK